MTTADTTSPKKGKNGMIIAISAAVILIIIVVVAVVVITKMKKKTTTTGGTTTGGTTTGGTTTSPTDATSLMATTNLTTLYSNNYKYYSQTGSLIYLSKLSSNSTTAANTGDSSWTTGPSCNVYNNVYGPTNSLLTRYDIITNNDTAAAYNAGTSGTSNNFVSIFPVGVNSSRVNPTYPTGFVLKQSFYAFSSDTVSSNTSLQSAVTAGTLIPLTVYGSNYGSGTVLPANALVANSKGATYTIALANNINPVVYPSAYTIYASKTQNALN